MVPPPRPLLCVMQRALYYWCSQPCAALLWSDKQRQDDRTRSSSSSGRCPVSVRLHLPAAAGSDLHTAASPVFHSSWLRSSLRQKPDVNSLVYCCCCSGTIRDLYRFLVGRCYFLLFFFLCLTLGVIWWCSIFQSKFVHLPKGSR